MDYKERLVHLFAELPYINKSQLAVMAGITPNTVRNATADGNFKVSEKLYNKIVEALKLALSDFQKKIQND